MLDEVVVEDIAGVAAKVGATMKSTMRSQVLRLAFVALLTGTSPAALARLFSTPEEAMSAFGEAVIHDNEPEMKTLFGANFRDLIPPVGARVRDQFLEAWGKSHAVTTIHDRAYIAVGNDGWTFPVPLVKSAGGWKFDTHAGAEEMRVRRVGRNEMAVIHAMLAMSEAQVEYARFRHDGDGKLAYASRLSGSPGKHDGLYRATASDEPPSPPGPAFLQASTGHASKKAYSGYHYKLLTAQGPNAPGGAYSYAVDGRLPGGFAILAWPVRYHDSGVMSFMVSHDGQVFERDLGADSAIKAAEITCFDPGPGWRMVSP